MRNSWMGSFAYCCQEGSWKCCVNPDFPTYTLLKKKGNFQTVWRHAVSWNFTDDLHSGVLWLYDNDEEFLNGVFGKLLSGALQKWHLAQSSPTYTPPQKKGNFRKVVFLLGKSVSFEPFSLKVIGWTDTDQTNPITQTAYLERYKASSWIPPKCSSSFPPCLNHRTTIWAVAS